MASIRVLMIAAVTLCCAVHAAAFGDVTVEVVAPLVATSGRKMLDWHPNINGDWDSCWEIGEYKWMCKRKTSDGDNNERNEGNEGNEGNGGNGGGTNNLNAQSASTPPPTPTPTLSGSTQLSDNIGKAMGSCSDPYVQAMVAADNRDRDGADALECDDKLSEMAVEHSKVQCDTRVMSHAGFKDGSGQCSPGTRCRRILDTGYSTTGENVAYRSDPLDKQVEATHDAWMNSDGHKENIQNPAFTAVGYGFHVCKDAEMGNLPVMYSTGLFGGKIN